MDYYGRIQKSIDYIEANLKNNITLEDISREAYSSLSHFHRIFHYMTDYSVKEYIRKRRLSSAAHDLICTKDNILEIALDYQYQSHETFTRAFKKIYGNTPIKYRKNQQEHVLFEKIDVFEPEYQNLFYDESIRVRFVTFNQLKIIGYELKTTLQNNQNHMDIPEFWDDFFANQKSSHIPNRIDPDIHFGIYTNLDYENNFSLIVSGEVSNLELIPKGMTGKVIPPTKYAAFTVTDSFPHKLANAWKYIYANWFPNNPHYERNQCDDFELYDRHNPNSVDIYIPIK